MKLASFGHYGHGEGFNFGHWILLRFVFLWLMAGFSTSNLSLLDQPIMLGFKVEGNEPKVMLESRIPLLVRSVFFHLSVGLRWAF